MPRSEVAVPKRWPPYPQPTDEVGALARRTLRAQLGIAACVRTLSRAAWTLAAVVACGVVAVVACGVALVESIDAIRHVLIAR